MQMAVACEGAVVMPPHNNRETLYSRYEHGLKPIHIISREPKLYLVEDEEKTHSFTSDRSLLMHLHDGYDPRITFDRYFRLGQHAEIQEDETPNLSVLGFFGGWGVSPKIGGVKPKIDDVCTAGPWSDLSVAKPVKVIKNYAQAGSPSPDCSSLDFSGMQVLDIAREKLNTKEEKLVTLKTDIQIDVGPATKIDPEVVYVPEETNQKPQLALVKTQITPDITVVPDTEIKLGIDLENRSHEVAKLMYAGFGGRIFKGGYDPEEVLQEVYKGLLARNIGKCPWDIRKSSFGHYVHMVIGCVLSNYHRREQRRRGREQVGLYTIGEDGWHLDDVAANCSIKATESQYQAEIEVMECIESLDEWILRSEGEGHEAKLARKILPWVREGRSRTEIAEYAGVSRSSIAKAITLLRRAANTWHQ
jgi:DNA-directed RNA polymerase specialized sigma24 family protein